MCEKHVKPETDYSDRIRGTTKVRPCQKRGQHYRMNSDLFCFRAKHEEQRKTKQQNAPGVRPQTARSSAPDLSAKGGAQRRRHAPTNGQQQPGSKEKYAREKPHQ